jgi:hypothetical protein
VSKLPGDVAAAKKKASQNQQTIDRHLTEHKLSERVVAYSDPLFRRVAVEWLVATDQVRLSLNNEGLCTNNNSGHKQ